MSHREGRARKDAAGKLNQGVPIRDIIYLKSMVGLKFGSQDEK